MKKYLLKATELYGIAFLQWRELYPSPVRHDLHEIREILKTTMVAIQTDAFGELRISCETTEGAALPPNFYETYSAAFVHEPKSYFINSFEQVGLQDPFPDEESAYECEGRLPTDFGDLVYARSRYEDDKSPYNLYLPNKAIMFKLMRACINVANPNKLWLAGSRA